MADWLIAAGITGLMVVIVMIVFYISGIFSRKNTTASIVTDEKIQKMDFYCKKRISELDERIMKLEQLLIIADEKLLQLMNQNSLAEENRLAGMTYNKPAGSRSGHENLDIKDIIKKQLNKEMNHHIRELKSEINKVLYDNNKSESVEALEESESILPNCLKQEKKSVRDKVFEEFESAPGYFKPELGDSEYTQTRFRDIFQLYQSGLSTEEISKVVRMEKNTIDLILGIRSRKDSEKLQSGRQSE